MSDDVIAFFIYAAIIRLAVLLTGAACVYMGFRLFVLGVMPHGGTDFGAQTGQIQLTLKNAAPGTCFATFGALVVVTMLLQSDPGYDRSDGDLRLRGYPSQASARFELKTQLSKGAELEDMGDFEGAINSYKRPISDGKLPIGQAARAIARIAAVYMHQDRLDEAVALARLAREARQKDAELAALLAIIQERRGKIDEAGQAWAVAAELNASLSSQLEAFRERQR